MEAPRRIDYELVSRPFVRAITIPRSVLFPAPGAVISTRGVRLRLDTQSLSIATDGLGPFVTVTEEAPAQPGG